MSWKDLEKGDGVNRVSSLPPGDLAIGNVNNVDDNEEDSYNSMEVKGVGVSGEVIDGSPLYYTRNQDIESSSDYILFFDRRSQLTVPVKESIVDDLWDEYIFMTK